MLAGKSRKGKITFCLPLLHLGGKSSDIFDTPIDNKREREAGLPQRLSEPGPAKDQPWFFIFGKKGGKPNAPARI